MIETAVPGVYAQPRYYEIAFSFRDLPYEVDVCETCIRRFAQTPVTHVLELAAGNAPHMPEWIRRGYRYTGLDYSPSMLEFARQKAKAHGAPAEFIQGDMNDFTLDEPVEFVYVMLGSLFAASPAQLKQHFDCVARALRPGGLYFLDWIVDFDPLCGYAETWEIEEDGVHMHVTCINNHKNSMNQTVEESITLDITEDGQRFQLHQSATKSMIYPQQFLQMLELRGDFEFCGWWNAWDMNQPIDGESHVTRPITVIRKKP